MIGRPAAADIVGLAGFLGDHGDFRMGRMGREEAVDIDRPETLGQRDMIVLAKLLVAEEYDAMFREGGLHGFQPGHIHVPQVHTADFRAAAILCHHFDPAHSLLPCVLFFAS